MRLNKEPIVEYMRSNITLMKWMNAEDYRYMNFDQIAEFKELADTVTV